VRPGRAGGRSAIPSHPSARDSSGRVAIETRDLRASECAEAERLLARAFRDNPLNVAVIAGDPARRVASNAHGMRALLPVGLRHGRVRTACAARQAGEDGRAGSAHRPDLLGALIATPPCHYPLPAPPLAARLRCLVGQGFRVTRRWATVFDHLDALHPDEPHWYLGTLGVDPAAWGSGVGSALLADFAARIDRDALPAYLETDRGENTGFYARQGFSVVGETAILGVPIWRMQRPPIAD
jgi:ribosomal protein S18 acetylase RimI-like enzyme